MIRERVLKTSASQVLGFSISFRMKRRTFFKWRDENSPSELMVVFRHIWLMVSQILVSTISPMIKKRLVFTLTPFSLRWSAKQE